jgi:opacity protein-like surface antigen
VGVVIVLMSTSAAEAQGVALRGFADVGSTTFTAAESFKAVLGSERGVVFGGGVEAVLPARVFVSVRASRFRKTGQRVFVFEGERFDLGIPSTVTVTPVEVTGGFRFDYGSRFVPYAGGGVGWHNYTESSGFSAAGEDVKERFTGYHVVGGGEFRIASWIGTAAEAEWANVPDALGQEPNGVSSEFDETDLGGVTLRVKIVIGR